MALTQHAHSFHFIFLVLAQEFLFLKVRADFHPTDCIYNNQKY